MKHGTLSAYRSGCRCDRCVAHVVRRCVLCSGAVILVGSGRPPKFCLRCQPEKQRAYRDQHKEEIAEKNRAYYDQHKDEIAEYQRAYRDQHKDEIAEYQRAYRDRHKEEIAEKKRAYYDQHKDEIAERHRQSPSQKALERDARVAAKAESRVTLMCECGHEVHQISHLVEHTRSVHGRFPTRSERTPSATRGRADDTDPADSGGCGTTLRPRFSETPEDALVVER